MIYSVILDLLMSQDTFLYLVRHGQTSWNAQGRLQGVIDIPLDDTGRLQALAVREKMASFPIAAVYASHLARAKETAEVIAAPHGHSVICDADLREGSWGIFDGMTRHEFHAQVPSYFKAYEEASLEDRWQMRVGPGADTTAEIQIRMFAVLQKIAAAYLGKSVVIVSHGWAIRSVLSFLLNRDDRKIVVDNGSFLRLHKNENSFEIAYHEGITL